MRDIFIVILIVCGATYYGWLYREYRAVKREISDVMARLHEEAAARFRTVRERDDPKPG